MTPEDEILAGNGVDGTTGEPLFAPLTVAEIAARARRDLGGSIGHGGHPDPHVPDSERGDDDIATSGWGILFPKGLDPAIRRAIEPLAAHRRAVAGDLYREIEIDPAKDDFLSFCLARGVAPGSPDRTLLPRYLLILGPPTGIPFDFQCLLNLEYGPGRLAFDTPAEYAAYAESVVAAERSAAPLTTREAWVWGPRRDPATILSADDLLTPLFTGWGRAPGVCEPGRARPVLRLGEEATKDALLAPLHRGPAALPPALLFTASHGVGFPSGHARQAREQGALLGAEWLPGDQVAPAHRTSAEDIGDDARVHGMVAFHFACFSAGTPALDSFPRDRGEAPAPIAPAPFIAALPQRLLAHPRGGALGVFGHVDRAWGYSVKRAAGVPQIGPFHEGVLRVLGGAPLGDVLADFARRHATLSASLLSRLDRRAPMSDRELAKLWIERNDAQGYVLLGDPGASLRGAP